MTRIHVRPGRPFDAGAMAALLNAIIARGGSTAFTTPVTGDVLRDWMAAGDAWHVAEQDGDVIGFQWVGPHADLPADTCDIATFVALDRHGLGVGSALFDASRRAARDRGYRFIVAVIRADNAGGLAYYGSRGFEITRHLPSQRLDDGTTVDKVLTSYRL
ncbi:GNAT family N-acetyltransferase [Jannaschia rubra]|uniref:Ribosomal-protein-alanine acetyltransferase n=1 Tax=Jannaschia rubra TaxID=282197 RepID=A0A0M6XP48_9RHOB|nr:GNAT family N-acetyltransferase [Jannaschia rubra]CTQ32452.1 ribosomal-protein-alanine acetyltransferase [Jannaschia rubra]SFF82523.1 L-amino acid N-acyltransferase YncA [Jannaschia rubra]